MRREGKIEKDEGKEKRGKRKGGKVSGMREGEEVGGDERGRGGKTGEIRKEV